MYKRSVHIDRERKTKPVCAIGTYATFSEITKYVQHPEKHDWDCESNQLNP
jgi:hypothetical protein